MALPPSEDGAVHDRLAWPSPAVALSRIGAPGTVAGVAVKAFEAGPVPTPLVAVTLNEWVVPLVKPAIVQLVAPPVVHVAPPGLVREHFELAFLEGEHALASLTLPHDDLAVLVHAAKSVIVHCSLPESAACRTDLRSQGHSTPMWLGNPDSSCAAGCPGTARSR